MTIMLGCGARSSKKGEAARDGALDEAEEKSGDHHRIITGDTADFNRYFALT